MKIACQSCQAKYTIADEKVVGKVVKIRCKKCGATIVVNGQERTRVREEPPTEATSFHARRAPVEDEAAEADAWTVNFADERPAQHDDGGRSPRSSPSGALSDETYCWRDGMGDWLPMREIAELAAACGLTVVSDMQHPQAPVAREPEPYPPAAAAPPSESYPGTPVAASAAASPESSAVPRRRGRVCSASRAAGRRYRRRSPGGRSRRGGRSLRRSGRGGQRERRDDERPAERLVAHRRDGKLTGQRNENSVLFSLATLTASAQKKAPDAGRGRRGRVGAHRHPGAQLVDGDLGGTEQDQPRRRHHEPRRRRSLQRPARRARPHGGTLGLR